MSGGAADRLALVAVVVPLLVLASLLCARSPKVVFLGWLTTVAFVPVWLGISLRAYFPLSSIAALAATAFLLRPSRLRWSAGDWLLAAAGAACLLPFFLGGVNESAVFQLLTIWVPGAVLGRIVVGVLPVTWIYSVVSVFFTIVATLAVIEFLAHWNPFVHVPVSSPSLFATWGSLQSRGGVLRAEGAFGHSIAMGSSLALAIPLTLASSFRPWIRLAMVGVMMAAVMVSFSRVSILSAGLAVVISALILRDALPWRWRAAILGVVAAGGAAAAPFVLSVFTASGSESTNSAAYRGDLLSLLPAMSPVGFSPIGSVSPAGRLFFGRFRSIDSALILTGLTYGAIALAICCVALIIAVILVLVGQANAPTIAVVAQIPAVATVALVTQYAMFFWFMVGLSVAAASAQNQLASSPRPVSDLHDLPSQSDQDVDLADWRSSRLAK